VIFNSAGVGFPGCKLLNYTITKLLIQESNHGKYSTAEQRRTQEDKTCRAQEGQSGKTEEAPRLRPRIEKTQGEEAGTRPVETVKQQLAKSPWHLAGMFPEPGGNSNWLNAEG
jgi:hypothetical protein